MKMNLRSSLEHKENKYGDCDDNIPVELNQSFTLTHWMLEEREKGGLDLTLTEASVFALILGYNIELHEAYHYGNGYLAKRLNVTERTIKSITHRLQEYGYIQIETVMIDDRYKKLNYYTVPKVLIDEFNEIG